MIGTTIYNVPDNDAEQRPPDDEWEYEIYARCEDGSVWWIRTGRKLAEETDTDGI